MAAPIWIRLATSPSGPIYNLLLLKNAPKSVRAVVGSFLGKVDLLSGIGFDRADLILPNPNVPSPSLSQWFNTSAFALAVVEFPSGLPRKPEIPNVRDRGLMRLMSLPAESRENPRIMRFADKNSGTDETKASGH